MESLRRRLAAPSGLRNGGTLRHQLTLAAELVLDDVLLVVVESAGPERKLRPKLLWLGHQQFHQLLFVLQLYSTSRII